MTATLEEDLARAQELIASFLETCSKEPYLTLRPLAEELHQTCSHLQERLEIKLSPLRDAERLTDEILETILALASLDFSKKVDVGYEDSEFNAVAMGMNMLGQELERAVRNLNEEIKIRKKAEEEARQREEKYKNIFEGTSVSLWEIDATAFREKIRNFFGEKPSFQQLNSPEKLLQRVEELSKCVVGVNEASVHMFGATSREELIGRSAELFDLNHSEWLIRLVKDVFQDSENFEDEVVLNTLQNKPIQVFMQIKFFSKNQAQATAIIAMIDMSKQKELEEQLRQSQKMEAIGKLAGGIAHDFNNLLMVMVNYGAMLVEELKENEKSSKKAKAVLECGERAAALTKHLLSFSRRQVIKPQELDLNEILAKIEKMLARLLGEDISLETFMQPNIDHVYLDPVQLEQIILNICLNARDAMPKGGRLVIETHQICFEHEYIFHAERITPGNYIVMSISDTGVGMNREVQKRIFEPFFTTKATGKGTGLGLATVYGNIKQNNGYIWFYSEIGQGTTFKVYFPVIQTTQHSKPPPFFNLDVSKKHTETILVVEDEDSVREVVVSMLKKAGYEVLEAGDGQAGLALAKAYNGKIHMVLSDIVMPRMNGKEMVDQLVQHRSDMKVLFMSGYTNNIIAQNGILTEKVALLEKPFTEKNLLEAVRSCIEDKRESPNPA